MYRKKRIGFVATLRRSKNSFELTIPKKIVDLMGFDEIMTENNKSDLKTYVQIELEVME